MAKGSDAERERTEREDAAIRAKVEAARGQVAEDTAKINAAGAASNDVRPRFHVADLAGAEAGVVEPQNITGTDSPRKGSDFGLW